jgi:nucleotide-binding universal stress UspA family protein
MFQRILVPLDGSTRAEQALPIATRIAKASNSLLLLAYIVDTTEDIRLYSTEPSVLGLEMQDKRLVKAAGYLAEVAQRPEIAPIHTHITVRSGSIAPQILNLAQEQQIDLMIICSHGYTGSKRFFLGSVSNHIVRHSTIPVLVIRDGGYVPAGPYPDPKRPLRSIKTLVAVDGSKRAEATLMPAIHLVKALAAPNRGLVELVQIIPPSSQTMPDILNNLVTSNIQIARVHKAKNYVRTLAQQLRQRLTPEMHIAIAEAVLVTNDVVGGIINAAEQGINPTYGGYDFIAMATHGRSGLAHLALGSITEHVLEKSKLPLLIVRPPDTMPQTQPDTPEQTHKSYN